MSEKVYSFQITHGWADSSQSWPVYDEYFTIVGSFVVADGGFLKAFIAGKHYPLALKVSTGDGFYATPLLGKNGGTEKIIISECVMSMESIFVMATEEK